MKSGLVSVLLSTRNRKEYFLLALSSVLTQTHKNLEIIIHDASTDHDTFQEIKKIKDQRIKVFRTKENLGMVGSWNYCLKKSRGEYIKYLADDDLLDKQGISQELRLLQDNSNVSLVTCVRKIIDENGRVVGHYKFGPKDQIVNGLQVAKEILTNIRENKIGEPTAVMFRRSDGLNAGLFDPQFSQYADFEFWIRILSLGDLAFIHRPLCSFRVHSTSGTTSAITDGRYIPETSKLISKYYDDPILSSKYKLDTNLKNRVKLQKFLDFSKTVKELFVTSKYLSAIEIAKKTLKFTFR